MHDKRASLEFTPLQIGVISMLGTPGLGGLAVFANMMRRGKPLAATLTLFVVETTFMLTLMMTDFVGVPALFSVVALTLSCIGADFITQNQRNETNNNPETEPYSWLVVIPLLAAWKIILLALLFILE